MPLILLPIILMVLSDSKTYTSVTTHVGGEGSVQTNITTTVNGQTTTVQSSEPGSIRVENNNGTVTVQTTPVVTPTITQTTRFLPKRAAPVQTKIFATIQAVWKRILAVFGFPQN